MVGSDRRARRRGGGPEAGSVVVLAAAAMGAILVMVALVLDLGGARHDGEADQLAADAMALAAAANLGDSPSDASVACAAAWEYLVVNLPTAESATAPSCSTFAATCAPATARQVETVVDQYRVTFTHPVPDGHELLTGQGGSSLDGAPCDRFGVRVQQSRDNLWAAGSVDLDLDAVSRFIRGVGDVEAPLILLDDSACGVLVMGGNADLDVRTSTGEPGYIAIDSDGRDCTNPNKLILEIDGNAAITAGVVSMYALADGDGTSAYDPDLELDPLPTASSAPVGRSTMDWRYNCSAANGCPGPGPAHIDDMVSDWGGAGEPLPLGSFTTWTTAGYSCSPSGDIVVPAGDWYIDCGTSGLTTTGSLTFLGGDIVTDGPIRASGSTGLRINCADSNPSDPVITCTSDPGSPTIFYQRSGNLVRTGNSELTMLETFVYLAGGTLDLSGNTTLTWTAPDDPTHPFDDLAVWTESSAEIKLTGNSALNLEGIVFAPNANVELSGNTGTDAIDAQLFARTAELSGNAVLSLAPSSDRMMQVGKGRPILIR